MWNLKNDTNELICERETGSKTETNSPTLEATCGYQRREGRGKGQVRDLGLIDINH